MPRPVIGERVVCGGHEGTLLGYREQAERNVRGKVITPPSQRWLVAVDLGETCNSREACSESVEHGVVNHHTSDVRFADTGELIPAAPESVGHLGR